ncbi:MAG TPA: thioredoxin-disulfide reductase [Gemmatimonadales bacterium]|nr:thioredoxin-disulfide reductase [Gemmatimonadales bacterium]
MTGRSTDETAPEAVTIIGSGPAAWTAAIYAARANLRPLVFEGEPSREMIPGGQLMFTTEIENFPGFPTGVDGQALMALMREQAETFGTRIITENVTAVDFRTRPHTLTPSYGPPVRSQAVIIATGARAIWLGLDNEERLAHSGGGVSACAVCDGALPVYRDKVVAVVGGGDSAMEEATYLTKYAREVRIIHRRDSFRASKVMADRALANPKIRVEWNTEVIDVLGDDFITGVRLRNTTDGTERTLEVGGLFIAIGHTPNTAFLDGALETTPGGYLVTPTPWRTATAVPGVFAAGDVIDDYYRQAITSAGTGCMAALEAERWLAHEGCEAAEVPMIETAESSIGRAEEPG